MTWLKLSDDFTNDTQHLSDAAFRAHVEALLYVMHREQGPMLTMRDVRRCMDGDNFEAGVDELIKTGFWAQVGTMIEIVHHMEHQPEPDVIAARKKSTAERVRKHRRKAAGIDETAEERSPLTAALPSRPDPTRPDPGNAYRNGVSNGVTSGGDPNAWTTHPKHSDDPWDAS